MKLGVNRGVTAAALCALLAGCDEGVLPQKGAREPIQVEGAMFFEGPLPESGDGPAITVPNVQSPLLFAGQAGKQIGGDAGKGATAILTRFLDIGSGYWSFPVGTPDPMADGALTWSATCDFSFAIPPGQHPLAFVAVDEGSAVGPVYSVDLTVQEPVPAGKVVLSLTWDSRADLDLHVQTPDGREIDPKHPSSAKPGTKGMSPGAGALDRDSNASCVQDNLRREDVVFADAPLPGTYLVRVDMFQACGAPSADFVLTVREDGAEKQTVKGRLLDIDADGGGPGSGLFVLQLSY